MVRVYPIIGPGDVFATRSIVGDLLRSGIRYLQIRGGTAASALTAARDLAADAVRERVTLVVNDRVDIAHIAGCGAHLGQSDIPIDDARRLLGWDRVIGLSTHNREEAANVVGADYVAAGPVFPTSTKPDAMPVIGVAGLKELAAVIRARTSPRKTPVVAIGGVTGENFRLCLDAGADFVAVVSALRVKGSGSRLKEDAAEFAATFDA